MFDKNERLKDKKLEQLYIRKNLSKSRINNYERVFRTIQEEYGYTPTQLLEIAKEEQQPKIIDNQIVFKELEDRTITQIQYDYYFYLMEKKLKPITIKSELGAYRAFLNEYNIQLPKPIEIKTHPPLYEVGDLPNKEDILKAVNCTNNKRTKAILYFMSSSGIRSVDTRHLRIQDFVNGCKYYFDNMENLTLEDIFKSNYHHIIPSFYFRPQKTSKHGNICCTFCSPEAVVSIVDYLKHRYIRSYDEPLFSTFDGGVIDNVTFTQSFQRINDVEFGRNDDGERFLKPKYLRKYFITTCNQHSGDLLKVRLLAGHSISNIDRAYNEISIPVMRRFYTTLLPYLSLTDMRVKDVKTKEYLDLERKLRKQELENEKLKDELDERINRVVEDVLRKYK